MRRRAPDGLLSARRIRRTKRKMSSDDVYEVALAALERSEAILENVGDGVYSTDPQGHVILWNRSAQRVTGCPSRKAQGRACSEVLGLYVDGRPLDCRDGCALLGFLESRQNGGGNGKAKSQATGNGVDGGTVEVVRQGPDGRDQPLLMNVTAIKDNQGGIAEVVHSMRDITALKLADEAKTMFLATASHELKTPLTVILGFTQALRSDWLPEEQRDGALGSIERRAVELSRIVDRLLLTGRIESGRITLDLAVVDLAEIVPERVSALAMVTGRTIECDLPEDIPPAVADPDAFTTVLDHLLDNAVKYSPDGGPITVRGKVDRTGVELEVADAGVGMNEEELARCFERFWQAESSDVRRFGGTGVGLYIVRSLMDGMGGFVKARSIPRAGSTFTLRLRRASDEEIAKLAVPQNAEPGVGQRTMIEEFMHQIGVPGVSGTAGAAGGRGGGS